MDIVARQPTIIPTTTLSLTASIPAFASISPTTTNIPRDIPSSSQISVGVQHSTLSTFSEQPEQLEYLEQPRPQPSLQKQLSPDRPEVLLQAYLAEKEAWLAQHPTVRPAEYRKARKWTTPRPKVLKEQAFYMPRERRELTGTIIADKANWTNEEITVWLDNEQRKDEEEYNGLQVEFDANGQTFATNGPRDIWARVEEEHARESERYIL